MNFILASQSPYRRQLIEKIGIKFECKSPAISEDALKTELLAKKFKPQDLAEELSLQKGLSVFNSYPQKNEILVLSGDQLVELDSEILGKPRNFENAVVQLQKLRNKTHRLMTAVTLISSKKIVKYTDVTSLKMHNLSDAEITGYLKKDQPYDCAGSYKIESRGIALFESVHTTDFTSIQGVPLIWLTNQLKEHNYEFFQS